MTKKKQIAVLITVYNRKELTLQCLKDIYDQECFDDYRIDIFVVDGGSKDGTPYAIKEVFPDVHVNVSEGLYWAGGMRKAWSLAIEYARDYDFFWLLNDDTHLYSNALKEAMGTHEYAGKKYGKGGLYIGSTQNKSENGEFSYGCRKLLNPKYSKFESLLPDGNYQAGDLANANIMMVSRDVYDKIGGFSDVYTHGIADYDYSLRATRAGFPCLACPCYCGECEDDHGNNWKPANSTIRERIEYLYSPKGLAYMEYMYYIKTFFPSELVSAWIKLWAKTLLPIVWDNLK